MCVCVCVCVYLVVKNYSSEKKIKKHEESIGHDIHGYYGVKNYFPQEILDKLHFFLEAQLKSHKEILEI